MTSIHEPEPGSRWLRRNGRHRDAEIEVTETNGLSVFFKARGGGAAMGNQKVDESKVNALPLETFMVHYVPRDQATGNGGGRAFRQRNVPKPKRQEQLEAELSLPLSLNGIGLDEASPLRVEILEITPALAESWLERGGLNRAITKTRINKLATAIRRGEWRLTGDSIKLDAEGRVRDGQHRLRAIIETGMPIRTLVVRGVGEEDFAVFDTGKARTPGDVMGIAGYKNRVGIASNARSLILIEATGRMDPPVRRELEGLYSHAALLRYVREHPDVEEGVLLANQMRVAGLAGGSGLLGTLFTLLLRADADAARLFAEQLSSGANLERDSPILRFRNRLITDRRLPNGIADREHLVALGVKAWNFWRAGEKVSSLTWHAQRGPGSRGGEAFPVAQ